MLVRNDMAKFVGAVAVVLGTVICPMEAMAQNTSFANSALMPINHENQFYLDNSLLERWFLSGPFVQNRSYCYELVPGLTEETWTDPRLEIYNGNGTTLFLQNDDSTFEPSLLYGSRVCFVEDAPIYHYARARKMTVGFAYLTLRLVETTLFSPWYSTDASNGYAAIAQIRNNTSNSIAVRVTYRTLSGATLCAPFNLTILANGTGLTYASNCGVATANGAIEIAHNGPPGGISANNTTLSGQSGLSFDAAFQPRPENRP